jgi:hypothetical protein
MVLNGTLVLQAAGAISIMLEGDPCIGARPHERAGARLGRCDDALAWEESQIGAAFRRRWA